LLGFRRMLQIRREVSSINAFTIYPEY
jgi:hypothetical protein